MVSSVLYFLPTLGMVCGQESYRATLEGTGAFPLVFVIEHSLEVGLLPDVETETE